MDKVLLGMSGGVDSSVSALLLKEQGFEVIGCTLELYNEGKCCNLNTYMDAKSVCKELGIDHITYDLQKEFKKYVIDDFINSYLNSKTPNPCVECNHYMKFGIMYDKAKELGCKYIATGHYAKIEYDDFLKTTVLKKANATKKDQTYFLWNIPKERLGSILFPLGKFNSKDEIRLLAKNNGLKVANKPDSQDICFVPAGDYKEFLEENASLDHKEGNIVDKNGNLVGKHNGLYKYTIGQRKGLGISSHTPLYAIGFNKSKNELIVGEEKDLYKDEVIVNDVNLLLTDAIKSDMEVDVKIRYATKPAKAKLNVLNDNEIKLKFNEPQRAITPGQSVVFYINDIVLGGGKIE